MKDWRTHIGCWLLTISCWLLVVGCSSSDGTEEPQPTMLTIYVYAPEHPMLIRSAIGTVDALVAERQVHKLQIWVFESYTGKTVGYLQTKFTDKLNGAEAGDKYQIPVPDEFAQHKPDVDVYVLANVSESNCGVVFDGTTTREQLRNAKLDANHFGLTELRTTVPDDGLPMAGILKDQTIVGDAPVLRIGTTNNIATVRLERTVSKVRFVIGTTAPIKPTITGISFDVDKLYNEGYLISREPLTGLTLKSTATPLLASERVIDSETDDPTKFIYDGQEAQEYENLINSAATAEAPAKPELTIIGPYYLHESDKQISGKIFYKIGEETTVHEGPFQMDAVGDFLRNHSWIVYAYYTGGGFLQMNAIYVKEWTTKEMEHEVYNW